MTHPLNNGTTTGSYCPMPMYSLRPGADAHKRFASLSTGMPPVKPVEVILPPPTTIAPRAKTMTAPKVQMPAKPVNPASKRKLKNEDYSTPYQPQTVLAAAPALVATDEPLRPYHQPDTLGIGGTTVVIAS